MTVIDWASLMQEAAQAVAAIPAGDYDIIVADCQYKTASTGKPMYVARFRVESGPHAGRTLINNIVVSPENPMAMRMFFRNMAAFGLDGNFFASNPTPETVAASLVNRRARVTVTVRQWKGEDRNDVQNIQAPLGGGAPAGAPLGGTVIQQPTQPAPQPQIVQPQPGAQPQIVQPQPVQPQPVQPAPQPQVAAPEQAPQMPQVAPQPQPQVVQPQPQVVIPQAPPQQEQLAPVIQLPVQQPEPQPQPQPEPQPAPQPVAPQPVAPEQTQAPAPPSVPY